MLQISVKKAHASKRVEDPQPEDESFATRWCRGLEGREEKHYLGRPFNEGIHIYKEQGDLS
jgi:hypothetical protein